MAKALRSGTLTGALLAPALLLALACGADATSRAARCAPHGARTIARDRSVRVYSLPGASVFAPRTYACLLRSGATARLPRGQAAGPESLGNFALGESVVGYSSYSFGVDSGCTSITVFDVAHRRTLRAIAQVGCTVDAGFIQLGSVSGLVVTPRGSVAWIVSRGRRGAESFEVHAAQASGPVSLLDQGPAIAPGSLRLAGSEVSWQDGTRRLTAKLR
jgi:hypothetical protein